MGSLYGALLRLRRLTLWHQGFWEAFAPSFCFVSGAASFAASFCRIIRVLLACFSRLFASFADVIFFRNERRFL